MKRKAALIYFIVFVVILGCILLTLFTKNSLFIYILFGFFFLLSIITIPFYLKRFSEEYKLQGSKEAPKVIDEINDNDDSQLQFEVSQVKNLVDTWKHSTPHDFIKGTLFLLLFLGCIVGFVVCMLNENYTLGFIFFGAAFGTILLAFIIVKILETRAIRFKKGKANSIQDTAVVIISTISSQSSSGNRRNVKVHNTTYKVILEIRGRRVTTYSKEYYTAGEVVHVIVNTKKPNQVSIVDRKTDSFELLDEEF
ncbi:MAG: hypothetical protein K2P14_11800 [Anaeroplasmataceae bacterium]|jgi:hypothetical protein|nr:hypothetical protein [Anaeroplasmataceae bacterium]